MRIIGVTGPTGSGKTQLTEAISALGIKTINADELYHSMLNPPSECLDAIKNAFGDNVLADDGSLDRAALSAIVFTDEQKLKLLNRTVLDIVVKEIQRIIKYLESIGEGTVVIDAPTLIESGFNNECNIVISVLSPKDERSKRIAERDNISNEKATERIHAQKPDAFYIENSDFIIYNSGTKQEFDLKIRDLTEKLHLLP